MSYIKSGKTITVYKTADETKVSDATLTIDTDLQMTLEASSSYYLEGTILLSSNSIPDTKLGFNYTGTFVIARYGTDLDKTDATMSSFGAFGISPGAGSLRMWNFVGFIETTSVGDLGFYWSQWTSDAASTTLLKNSTLKVTKLN